MSSHLQGRNGLALLALLTSCGDPSQSDEKRPQDQVESKALIENSVATANDGSVSVKQERFDADDFPWHLYVPPVAIANADGWGPVTQMNPDAVRLPQQFTFDLTGFQGRIRSKQPRYAAGEPIWLTLEVRNAADVDKRLYWTNLFAILVSFKRSEQSRISCGVFGRAVSNAHTGMDIKEFGNSTHPLKVGDNTV